VLLADGRAASVRAAEAELRHALALVEQTGARSYEPALRFDLAEVARLRGDADTRGDELRRAEQLLAAMGLPSQAAVMVAPRDS
jgi:ATP/maltotriose-dependent transcriptional regulator MalT